MEIESYNDYGFQGIEVERGLMTDWDTPVTSLEIPKSVLTPTFTYMGTISHLRLADMSEPEPEIFAIGAYEGTNVFMIVALKPQTLDFAPLPPQSYPSEPFALEGLASSGLPRLDESEGRLVLTYIRRKAATNPGISYAVEFSGALAPASWEINPAAVVSASSIDATFERVTVTDSGVFTKRFARVRVRCD